MAADASKIVEFCATSVVRGSFIHNYMFGSNGQGARHILGMGCQNMNGERFVGVMFGQFAVGIGFCRQQFVHICGSVKNDGVDGELDGGGEERLLLDSRMRMGGDEYGEILLLECVRMKKMNEMTLNVFDEDQMMRMEGLFVLSKTFCTGNAAS